MSSDKRVNIGATDSDLICAHVLARTKNPSSRYRTVAECAPRTYSHAPARQLFCRDEVRRDHRAPVGGARLQRADPGLGGQVRRGGRLRCRRACTFAPGYCSLSVVVSPVAVAHIPADLYANFAEPGHARHRQHDSRRGTPAAIAAEVGWHLGNRDQAVGCQVRQRCLVCRH